MYGRETASRRDVMYGRLLVWGELSSPGDGRWFSGAGGLGWGVGLGGVGCWVVMKGSGGREELGRGGVGYGDGDVLEKPRTDEAEPAERNCT